MCEAWALHALCLRNAHCVAQGELPWAGCGEILAQLGGVAISCRARLACAALLTKNKRCSSDAARSFVSLDSAGVDALYQRQPKPSWTMWQLPGQAGQATKPVICARRMIMMQRGHFAKYSYVALWDAVGFELGEGITRIVHPSCQ